MERDLPELWLPLLRRLSDASPDQGVWKNAEAGLRGAGDVDFIAHRSEWEGIRIRVQAWAAEMDLGPVIICRHMPHGELFLTVDRSVGDYLQLDVRDRATFRGSTVFEAGDVVHLMQTDERGFRRLRAGAEGLIKLVISGTGPGGRRKPRTISKENVVELLEADAAGVRAAAASVFKRVEDCVLAGAEAALEGNWNRRAMATVEAWFLIKGMREPATVAARARARRAKKQCAILRTSLGNARRIPGEVDRWLAEVARDHRVTYDASDRG